MIKNFQPQDLPSKLSKNFNQEQQSEIILRNQNGYKVGKVSLESNLKQKKESENQGEKPMDKPRTQSLLQVPQQQFNNNLGKQPSNLSTLAERKQQFLERLQNGTQEQKFFHNEEVDKQKIEDEYNQYFGKKVLATASAANPKMLGQKMKENQQLRKQQQIYQASMQEQQFKDLMLSNYSAF